MKFQQRFVIAILCFCSAISVKAQPITVKPDKPVSDIASTMWGIFFEDINFAADGGLYAELVKNRSFEFAAPMMGWKDEPAKMFASPALVVNRENADSANNRFIKIAHNGADGAYALVNEGFRGMGINKDEEYKLSFMSKLESGNIIIKAELIDTNNNVIGKSSDLKINNNNWQTLTTSFNANTTYPKAKLRLSFHGNGVVDLDMISLFPKHTWKERPGGLRADLVQLLADMQPGFLRFPGGCIVEGRDLATRYQWKKTIGPVDERKTMINRWNNEIVYRPTPDYFQTFGLGFFEYFQLAEDIGASPLPILNCGMACQFNTGEVVDTNHLEPFIQDALDLVEFANGDTTTTWGHLRASLGHPAPFNLKMIGIGNEQWGLQYVERYKIFSAAVKSKYPGIQTVNSVGPFPDGDMFNLLSDTMRAMHADFLDEHYYQPPSWFQNNTTRYDKYPRNGTKIFAGEYAAQSVRVVTPDNKNTWLCALSEAAFMTGLERNAAVVRMASYAPLLANVEAWQWTPDLIWFDNLRSYGTPDYYVQKLFANNKGTDEVSILMNDVALTGKDSLYAAASTDKVSGELIMKIVNTSSVTVSKQINIDSKKKIATKATIITLRSNNLNEENSLDEPVKLSPKISEIETKNKQLNISLSPYSVTIVRIKML